MKPLINGYRCLIRGGKYVLPVVLLLMRLGWGWELFESGRGHLQHFDQTVSFFRDLHIPAPELNVRISASTEMVGGILWMLGFGTRLISIPLFFNFCVAYLTASRDNLVHLFSPGSSGADFATRFDKIVDDSAFPFLMLSLVLIAVGPGLISIDGLLKKTVFGKHDPQLSDTSQKS
jgi:putative oxidoreductase